MPRTRDPACEWDRVPRRAQPRPGAGRSCGRLVRRAPARLGGFAVAPQSSQRIGQIEDLPGRNGRAHRVVSQPALARAIRAHPQQGVTHGSPDGVVPLEPRPVAPEKPAPARPWLDYHGKLMHDAEHAGPYRLAHVQFARLTASSTSMGVLNWPRLRRCQRGSAWGSHAGSAARPARARLRSPPRCAPCHRASRACSNPSRGSAPVRSVPESVAR